MIWITPCVNNNVLAQFPFPLRRHHHRILYQRKWLHSVDYVALCSFDWKRCFKGICILVLRNQGKQLEGKRKRKEKSESKNEEKNKHKAKGMYFGSKMRLDLLRKRKRLEALLTDDGFLDTLPLLPLPKNFIDHCDRTDPLMEDVLFECPDGRAEVMKFPVVPDYDDEIITDPSVSGYR